MRKNKVGILETTPESPEKVINFSTLGELPHSYKKRGDGRAPDNLPDEIININVGGTLFQTYQKTIDYYPDTLLGDYNRRKKYMNPETGELFFDRHRYAFEYILYYYQSQGTLEHPPQIPFYVFIRELRFFDIDVEVIENLQIKYGVKEAAVIVELSNSKSLQKLWNFLEHPDTSLAAEIFAIASVIVISISLIMFVLESMPEFSDIIITKSNSRCNCTVSRNISIGRDILSNNCTESNDAGTIIVKNKHKSWMHIVNTAVIVYFTVEFILRVISCPSILSFFIAPGNIIDFLSILPYYLTLFVDSSNSRVLSVIRVIRVLRVLKLSRHSGGLQVLARTIVASFEVFLMIGFFLFVMILIFSSIVYFTEYQEEGRIFTSIPHTFWWTVGTLTTVGYGDLIPTSAMGKVVGALAGISGIMVLALPAPSVISNFTYFSRKARALKEANKMKMNEAKRNQEKEKGKAVVLPV